MSEQLEGKSVKSEAEIQGQISRIARKLVDRSNASEYGSRPDIVTISEPNPNGDGQRITTVEAPNERKLRTSTEISETISNGIAEVGTNVSSVPKRGVSAQAFGRAGEKNVYRPLTGEREENALKAVPAQLARVRGAIAQREIERDKAREEIDKGIAA